MCAAGPTRRAASWVRAGTVLGCLGSGLIVAPAAQAATAPGQDINNDWGQSAAEVDAEITAVVDADVRVVAARTRYLRALANYGTNNKALRSAQAAHRQALLTASPRDDRATARRVAAIKARVLPLAQEVVAAQLAMTRTVTAVTAQARSLHYVRAPYVAVPGQPLGLAAIGGSGQVTLTWDAVDGASDYRVYRDGVQIATTLVPGYLDTGLTDGTAYGYTVRAANVAGWSPLTDEVVGVPTDAPPAAPSGISTVPGDGQVSLTWGPVPGATSYNVYRDGGLVGSPTGTAFTDTGLTDGVSYGYSVEAVNVTVASPRSLPVTAVPVATAPQAPASLAASPGDGRVSLSWSAAAGATSYQVLRNGTVVASTTETVFTDTGLVNGTGYTYQVVALRLNSPASTPSPSTSATPVAAQLTAPGSLSASPGDGQVLLSWTASPGATGYSVSRNGVVVATTTVPSYSDTGLVNGTAYEYAVVATSPLAPTSAATTVTATPAVPPPAAPTGLSGSAGDTTTTLTWNPVTNADSYHVYRNGTLIASPTTTTYTDTGLTDGTTYTYTVTALRTGTESPTTTPLDLTPAPTTPGTPVGLVATPGDTTTTLTWTPAASAQSYRLYRNGTLIATPATTTYTDTGLTDGTTYSYTVIAVNGTATSPASTTVTATPAAPALTAPSGLWATPGSGQVALSWTTVSGATGYRVYRNGALVGSPGSASFTDTGLVNNTSYSYSVVAVSAKAASAASAVAVVTPAAPLSGAPTGLGAKAGNTSAALRWNAVTLATSYKVYRDGTLLTTVSSTSYTNTGLTNGTGYSYSVTAVVLGVESAASTTVTVTPVATAPAVPAALTATPGTGQIGLSWSAAANAQTYQLYRDGTLIATVATTSYADTGLLPATSYGYYLVSVNGASVSAPSRTVSATTTDTGLAAPTGLTASPGDAQVALSWTASPGATSYQVFRDGTLLTTVLTPALLDTGLVNGTTYHYSVIATAAGSSSAPSATVTATPAVPPPAAPTGLSGSAGDTTTTLTWNPVTNADSYHVYRNGTLIASPTTTTYTDTGLTDGTTYSYTVIAVNGTATSPASTTVTATPMAPAPAAPTGLTATPGDATVVLAWTAVPTATSYRVYRAGVLVASPATATYTDTGLVNGTSYGYYVVAVNATTPSTASVTVTATPVKPPVNGTFTGTTTAIAQGHGTIRVVIVVSNSKITSSTGTLVTNDGSTETLSINANAIPQYNTKAVAANSSTITKVSGATLTWSAYKTSLQSALTQAGM